MIRAIEPEEEDEEVTAEDVVVDVGKDVVGTTYEVHRMIVVGPAVIVGQEGGDQEFSQSVGLVMGEALLGGVFGTKLLVDVVAHGGGIVEELVVVLDVVVVGGVAQLVPATEAESC